MAAEDSGFVAWAWDQEAEQSPEGVLPRELALALEHVDHMLGGLTGDELAAEDDITYYGRFGVDQPTAALWRDVPDQLEAAIARGEQPAIHFAELLDLRDAIEDGTADPEVVAWHRDMRLDQLEAMRLAEAAEA